MQLDAMEIIEEAKHSVANLQFEIWVLKVQNQQLKIENELLREANEKEVDK